jgi:hypothetical protein
VLFVFSVVRFLLNHEGHEEHEGTKVTRQERWIALRGRRRWYLHGVLAHYQPPLFPSAASIVPLRFGLHLTARNPAANDVKRNGIECR